MASISTHTNKKSGVAPPLMSTTIEDENAESAESAESAENSIKSFPLASGPIHLLCEVVGATNLLMVDDALIADAPSWDNSLMRPYCIIKLGGKSIHQTGKAEAKGCNPIWTLNSRSVFAITTTTEELACDTKLSITICSNRHNTLQLGAVLKVQHGVFLGHVQLDVRKILSQHCTEERLNFPLVNELQDEAGLRGSVALRFRIATQSDLRFIQTWNGKEKTKSQKIQESKRIFLLEEIENNHATETKTNAKIQRRELAKTLVTERNETIVAGDNIMNAFAYAFRSTSLVDQETGMKKVRIKPYPEPNRQAETTFMAPHELKLETKNPSFESSWVEAGSGQLGRVYLEVLSCHDLPNVDLGEGFGNFTDSFVAAIFEDALVETPVIDDELNPHWLPWTNRAFIFNMMHPGSTLYLGVFDYDIGPTGHEPIGRVAVNLNQFKRDTVYTLKYNLYPSSNVTERSTRGVITIRLRIEIYDEKAALVAALTPRPNMHINVEKKKSFRVVRYTCFGEYDNEEAFDLTVLRSYINEIFEYKSLITYTIGDALRSLMFWRGQIRLFNTMMPIHSLMFFVLAVNIVERPHLAPAYFFLSIPWVLLATMKNRRQHPSPWNRCPSFTDYLRILKGSKAPERQNRIDALEGSDEARVFECAWKERLENDQKAAERQADMQRQLREIGDDIRTQIPGAIPIDLLVRLGTYQGMLGGICKKIRLAKVVLSWEESILAFWITVVFLTVGIISLFLPWKFILTWTGRILVYGFLGPQMKLVDLILTAKKQSLQGASANSSSGNHHKTTAANKQFDQLKTLARIKREDAIKIKAVKCMRFGEFITLVPNFNLARYYDRPLPESTARIWKGTLLAPNLQVTKWVPRQQLYGAMIPRAKRAALRNRDLSMKERDKRILSVEHIRRKMAKVSANKRWKTTSGPDEIPESIGYELIPYIEAVIQKNKEKQKNDVGTELERLIHPLQSGKYLSLSVLSCGMEEDPLELGSDTGAVAAENINDGSIKGGTTPENENESVDKNMLGISRESEDGEKKKNSKQQNAGSDEEGGDEEIDGEGREMNEDRTSVNFDAHTCSDYDEQGLEVIAFEPSLTEVGTLSSVFRESPSVDLVYYR